MNYEIFSAPVPMGFPEEWYDFSGDTHFWLKWRMQVLRRLMAAQTLPTASPLRVLEVGCGRGALRTQLETATAWTVDGADINEAALREAKAARGRTLLYNVQDKKADLKESYDGIILFDVVEHIQEPGTFLKDIVWHLKAGGWLLVNVPALPSLYSRYDKMVGHFQRYHKRSMRDLLENGGLGLELTEMRYWGFLLLPIAWLRKKVLEHVRADKVVATGFNPPSAWINSAFTLPMTLETFCLERPPSGTSLMVLARKKQGSFR